MAQFVAMSEAKATVDWERIEFEYRAGLLSLREIAAAHPGTNHVAITRRAKKEGWTRDLSAKIKAKAEDLVTRSVVTPAETESRSVTEQEVIDAGAAALVRIRTTQRNDINSSRNLATKLLNELEGQTDSLKLLEQLGELLRAEDDKGVDKLNDLYHKVIALPSRIKGIKDLAETLKTLIGLEREAWGLVNIVEQPVTLEKIDPVESLRRLAFALTRGAHQQGVAHG